LRATERDGRADAGTKTREGVRPSKEIINVIVDAQWKSVT